MAHSFGLSDWDNQIFEMKLAVARAGEEHLQARPFAVAGTTGLLKFSNQPFHYEAGNNKIISLQENDLFPLRVQAWGVNQGGEEDVEMEVDSGFSSEKDFLLQGNKGCLLCCCNIGTLILFCYQSTLGTRKPSKTRWGRNNTHPGTILV